MVATNFVPEFAPNAQPVPAGLADFIQEKELPGRIFNDYPTSGYLEWRFGDRLPLYIDLLNAYHEELHLEYGRIVRGIEDGREILERRDIGYIVIASPNPEGPWLRSLEAYLKDDPRWVLVYAKEDGALWVRRTPEYEYVWRSAQP